LSGYLIAKISYLFGLLAFSAVIFILGYLSLKALPEKHPLRLKLLSLGAPYAFKIAKIIVFVVIVSYFLGALILYG
jgi:hypothetical protein